MTADALICSIMEGSSYSWRDVTSQKGPFPPITPKNKFGTRFSQEDNAVSLFSRSQDCACLDIFDIVIIEVPEVQSLLLIDKRCSRTSGVKLIL